MIFTLSGKENPDIPAVPATYALRHVPSLRTYIGSTINLRDAARRWYFRLLHEDTKPRLPSTFLQVFADYPDEASSVAGRAAVSGEQPSEAKIWAIQELDLYPVGTNPDVYWAREQALIEEFRSTMEMLNIRSRVRVTRGTREARTAVAPSRLVAMGSYNVPFSDFLIRAMRAAKLRKVTLREIELLKQEHDAQAAKREKLIEASQRRHA